VGWSTAGEGERRGEKTVMRGGRRREEKRREERSRHGDDGVVAF